ncbi:MAG: helix-turn-helix domain-containing protein [Fibromonadales bacterium]|nr:helix-turn-helix domain-containing protein [Fibromonadales bacterium]
MNQPPIRIEAPVIPRKLVSFLRLNYRDVKITPSGNFAESDLDTAAMPVQNMDWYKEARAKMTPSGNLSLLRKNRNLTQKALADKSGIAATAISDMEHNRIPIGRKSAQKLAEALGTSIGNLFW